MTQLIHLSRHGTTKQNDFHRRTGLYWSKECKDIEGFTDITDYGREQACVLGNYVCDVLMPRYNLALSDVVIVTSDERRSRNTGEIVRGCAGIPGGNVYSSERLNENVPLEWVAQTESDDPYYLNWLSKRIPLAEIGEMVRSEFDMLAERYEGRHIVAPLHNALNRAFLQHCTGTVMSNFDNCGLLTLENKNGIYSIVGYPKTNDELRSDSGQSLSRCSAINKSRHQSIIISDFHGRILHPRKKALFQGGAWRKGIRQRSGAPDRDRKVQINQAHARAG
ncbi:histidine phosphatase family protein [Candidatus Woesearchaeota archaeon]|nr:histidine phosphatase family protein [Candidatus Woesearchaeota archaeon]